MNGYLENIEFSIAEKSKDPNHYQRRKQQRAISEDMIRVCLDYGIEERIRGAVTYTLLDKSIVNTIYSKSIDRLRGLRVVIEDKGEEPYLLTTYWVSKVKKRPPKRKRWIKKR